MPSPPSWFTPDVKGRCFLCRCTPRSEVLLLAAQAVSAVLVTVLASTLASVGDGQSACTGDGKLYDAASECVAACHPDECLLFGRELRNASLALAGGAGASVLAALVLALQHARACGLAASVTASTVVVALGCASASLACLAYWYVLGAIAGLQAGILFGLSASLALLVPVMVAATVGTTHLALQQRERKAASD